MLRTVLLLVSILMAAPAPAKSDGSFRNAGLTLHYREEGRGDPIVLLAGGPGFDSGYLRGLVALLRPKHRVIQLDLRGTGRSTPATISPATVSLALIDSDLEALRRRLGLRRWTVLGHSFGSLVAMRYALAHPRATRRLVLLATLAPSDAFAAFDAALQSRLTPAMAERLQALDTEARAAATPTERSAIADQVAAVLLPAYFADPARIAQFLPDAGPLNAETNAVLSSEATGYDLQPGLAALRVPTLIVQGAADPLTPEIAERTRAAIPCARLAIIPAAGHFAWVEAAPDVQRAIETFMAR